LGWFYCIDWYMVLSRHVRTSFHAHAFYQAGRTRCIDRGWFAVHSSSRIKTWALLASASCFTSGLKYALNAIKICRQYDSRSWDETFHEEVNLIGRRAAGAGWESNTDLGDRQGLNA
jgi:hypothetical protein